MAHFTDQTGTFLGFSVVCLLGAVFTLLFVPETKNRTLEEIELLFMSKEAREQAIARKEERRSTLETSQHLDLNVPEIAVQEESSTDSKAVLQAPEAGDVPSEKEAGALPVEGPEAGAEGGAEAEVDVVEGAEVGAEKEA
ncbi:facilitated trehalose transporter tret1 [Plakobranchus ocellatus]|uniref:Facilitated trehalose transporter tret1 n=1 Tax=Plakobranchus ocellatus TaxID=259542 RepID=A0AAV3ZND7_9GAST|nr:facilitated trehalose transporter tret1 [Plakobranchus ocellatus]